MELYVYDVENRLVGKTTGTVTTSLRYDPLGRLYELVDPATGTTRFLYDGDALVGEYNASGTQLARYGHGALAGVDDPLVSCAGSAITTATARFLYADPRGSIVLATNSSGAATAINAYDEYGIPGTDSIGQIRPAGVTPRGRKTGDLGCCPPLESQPPAPFLCLEKSRTPAVGLKRYKCPPKQSRRSRFH